MRCSNHGSGKENWKYVMATLKYVQLELTQDELTDITDEFFHAMIPTTPLQNT